MNQVKRQTPSLTAFADEDEVKLLMKPLPGARFGLLRIWFVLVIVENMQPEMIAKRANPADDIAMTVGSGGPESQSRFSVKRTANDCNQKKHYSRLTDS